MMNNGYTMNVNAAFMSVFLISILFFGCESQQVMLPDTGELLSIEDQRVQYLTSGNYDSLEAMISPTLSYSHSNALIDSKGTYMEGLRSGRVVYKSLNHRDVEARIVTPDTGILNGITDGLVNVEGEDVEISLRFTIVYVQRDGEWLFESWQSTSVPQE